MQHTFWNEPLHAFCGQVLCRPLNILPLRDDPIDHKLVALLDYESFTIQRMVFQLKMEGY